MKRPRLLPGGLVDDLPCGAAAAVADEEGVAERAEVATSRFSGVAVLATAVDDGVATSSTATTDACEIGATGLATGAFDDVAGVTGAWVSGAWFGVTGV